LTALSWILLASFWLLLAAAAISDLRSLRISNTIVVLTFAAALAVLVLARHQSGPWWQHVAAFAIMLGTGILLFSLGWIGGGDAKLAAAAAVLFDLRELIWFVAATALAGGLLTIVLMLLRRWALRGGASRWQGLAKGRTIPYGVAIAAGAVAVSASVIGPF
jgi:prepilin peptidase CpaA